MVEVIMDDRRAVLPVSVCLTGQYDIHDVCISIPAVLGRNGVEATIEPDLSVAEVEELRRSAQLRSHLFVPDPDCGLSAHAER